MKWSREIASFGVIYARLGFYCGELADRGERRMEGSRIRTAQGRFMCNGRVAE